MNSFLVFAAGSPDEYGNQILYLYVYQKLSAPWNWTRTISSANYTSNFEVNVEPIYDILFNVTVKLNYTMAANEAEAVTNTQVFMNITDTDWENVEMDDWNDGGTDEGTHWTVTYSEEWTNATAPVEGGTYYITFEYEAYR